MKKKFLVIGIVLAIITIFTACTNNSENDNKIDEENENDIISENNENEEEIVETIKVSYIGQTTDNPEMENNLFIQNFLEEKFNIEIELNSASGGDKENFTLLIAGDSLPDCGWTYLMNADLAATMYSDGAIRGIPIEMVEEYAPNYYNIVQEEPLFHKTQLAENEKDYFCLYAYRYGYVDRGYSQCFRKDWLENLSIPLKGDVELLLTESKGYITNEPYTIDEFTDILYEFTFSDPDMNNENDTWGLNIYEPTLISGSFYANICSAYSIRPSFTTDEYGWAIDSDISPNAKNGFKKLAEWIDKKVIISDFKNTDWDVATDLWINGKVGTVSLMFSEYDYPDDMPSGILKINPEASYLITSGLVDNDGNGGQTPGYHDTIMASNSGFFFINSKVTDDEKLKRILMFFDYISADNEGSIFCRFGNDGVHHEFDPVYLKYNEIDNSDLTPEESVILNAWQVPCNTKALTTANPLIQCNQAKVKRYSLENWPVTYHPYAVLIINQKTVKEMLGLEKNKSVSRRANKVAEIELMDKLFSGDSDIDQAFDSYLAVLEANGYDEYYNYINTHAFLYDDYIAGNFVTPMEKYPK